MGKRAGFVMNGFLHEVKDDIIEILKKCGANNIHQSVEVEHEDSSRVIIDAHSPSGVFHKCAVKIELREIGGRQTQVTVIDNDNWGSSCSRDGHVEHIACELENDYYRLLGGTNRVHRRS